MGGGENPVSHSWKLWAKGKFPCGKFFGISIMIDRISGTHFHQFVNPIPEGWNVYSTIVPQKLINLVEVKCSSKFKHFNPTDFECLLVRRLTTNITILRIYLPGLGLFCGYFFATTLHFSVIKITRRRN